MAPIVRGDAGGLRQPLRIRDRSENFANTTKATYLRVILNSRERRRLAFRYRENRNALFRSNDHRFADCWNADWRHRDLVDGKRIFFIELDDGDELAWVLGQMPSDRGLRAALDSHARSRGVSVFSLSLTLSRVIDLYGKSSTEINGMPVSSSGKSGGGRNNNNLGVDHVE
jgi:hypothetical protein